MIAEAMDGEHQITTQDLAGFEANPPIVYQERLTEQDTPESKWFADQSGKEFFVTPDNWVYESDGTHATLVGNLTHGRVMRMTMETQTTERASDLGKAHERSEERRVGKEWRSRWAPYHEQKKLCHPSMMGKGW